jgi:ABC-type phosphonate transport system ATPase subunit
MQQSSHRWNHYGYPKHFLSGMQQWLQIASNLVTRPRLIFMDEPTASLDVWVQACLLDLLRQLVSQLQVAAVIVTHDLAVARLLARRLIVKRDGVVIEEGSVRRSIQCRHRRSKSTRYVIQRLGSSRNFCALFHAVRRWTWSPSR